MSTSRHTDSQTCQTTEQFRLEGNSGGHFVQHFAYAKPPGSGCSGSYDKLVVRCIFWQLLAFIFQTVYVVSSAQNFK